MPKKIRENRYSYWVVLVDDEISIRLAVGDYLYEQGYQVTACADAEAFLDICQRGYSEVRTTTTTTTTTLIDNDNKNLRSGKPPPHSRLRLRSSSTARIPGTALLFMQ